MKNISAKELRCRARASLKGNWGQAILIFIIYWIISFSLNFLFKDFLGQSLEFLNQIIIIPLMLGITFYFLNLSRNKGDIRNLFKIFKSKLWLKAIGLYILYIIGAFIALIPLVIVMVLVALHSPTQSPINSVNFSIAYIIGLIIGFAIVLALFIPLIIYVYTFSQINPIFLDNKDLSIIEIFRKSRIMMKGFKWNLFLLQLSYIGWFILSIISLGIGFLWLAPYFIEGEIAFYNEIKDINFSNTENYTLNIENSVSL